MIRRRGAMFGAAALAVLVAAMPVDALAKRKSNRKTLVVTIDGKRFKPTRRTVALTAGGGTIGFSVLGQKIPGARGTIKTLYVACAVLWPQPNGSSSTYCLTQYSEVKATQPAAAKYWTDIGLLGSGSTTVTFDNWDGTVIEGRLSATVPGGPTTPSLPPITVQGAFKGPVVLGDPNR